MDTMAFEESTTRRGTTTKRAWVMVGSREYGLPRLYDLDLYIALNVLAERHGYEARLIKTTIHELCTIPRLTPGGATYERIKAGVRRFIHTGYSARGVFWAEGAKQPIALEEWRILTEARLLPSAQDGGLDDGLPPSYILLGEKFLKILKRERRKPLDLTLWSQLGPGIAKPLYHYLDTSLYKREKFEIGLNRLGNHIGQTSSYAPSQVMRLYAPHLKRFVDLGFLSGYKFDRSRSKEDPYKLIVFPGQKARRSVCSATKGRDRQEDVKQRMAGRLTRNSGYLESSWDDRDTSLRRSYEEWCVAEVDRLFHAIPSEQREGMVAKALEELGKSQHGGRLARSPDYFRRRMAENRVRQSLAQNLPTFDAWRAK